MIWFSWLAPRASRLAPVFLLLAASLACSQNSYRWEGKEPPPPKNPRNAHIIKKEGSGMNVVGTMEESGAAGSTEAQGPAFTAKVVLSAEVEKLVKPGSTLFVIARSIDGNPAPVAAVKARVDQFPAMVTITEKDSMDGTPLPGKVDVVARLDEDGDLTTKHPTDLISRSVRVEAGEPFTILLYKAPEQ